MLLIRWSIDDSVNCYAPMMMTNRDDDGFCGQSDEDTNDDWMQLDLDTGFVRYIGCEFGRLRWCIR